MLRFKHARRWPTGNATPRYCVVLIGVEGAEPLVTDLTWKRATAYRVAHDPAGATLEVRRCDT